MINKVHPSQAWQPGATIWVTAETPGNSWPARFDWKLNFMPSKEAARSEYKLNPELKTLCEKQNFSWPRIQTTPELRIFCAQNFLPSEMVVILPSWEHLADCLKLKFPYQSQVVRIFGTGPIDPIALKALSSRYEVEWVESND